MLLRLYLCRLATLVVVAVFVIVVLQSTTTRFEIHAVLGIRSSVAQHMPTLHSNIRIVNASSMAFPPRSNDCLVASVDDDDQTGDRTFFICPYPSADDPHVSGGIRRGHYYELNKVRLMLRLLRSSTAYKGDKIFIDIGTNVGVYSLAVGHAGYQVISLEPNSLTMRYFATSVVRGNLTSRVTLVNNAVSNEHTVLRLGVEMRNRGNSFLLPADTNCTDGGYVAAGMRCQTNVLTVTLNDLLTVIKPELRKRKPAVVVKVDAQGSEMKIFDPDTSADFFRHVDVFAMQLEWELIASNYTKQKARKKEVDRVLHFLYSLNFTVHPLSAETNNILDDDWARWPYDVLLLRH